MPSFLYTHVLEYFYHHIFKTNLCNHNFDELLYHNLQLDERRTGQCMGRTVVSY